MADHTLDREPGIARIADDINTLKNQLSELRTLQQQGASAVNLTTTGDYTTSVTLGAGGAAFFNFTLANASNQRLFGTFEYTLYEGSIALANVVGSGTNNFFDHYDIRYWPSKFDSDGNNLKERVFVKNITAGSLTVYMVGSWRYIVGTATGSA